MTSPQTLHDAWLAMTVIVTLQVAGIAIYLWRMFRWSNQRRFFWALALAFASIAVEQSVSEIKNLYHQSPLTSELAWFWLGGRIQQAVILTGVIGYLVFGRDREPKT